MTAPTRTARHRQQVERASRIGTFLYAEPAIVAAAALLDDWLAAADRHAVARHPGAREELAGRLAHAALDAVAATYRARDAIPDRAGAAALLDAAAQVLHGRGVDTARDGDAVAVPRTPASPPWGPDGTAGLVIDCTADGWDLGVDVPMGPAVTVVAPHDATHGAAAVVDLALAVAAGEYDNPFGSAARASRAVP